MHPSLRAVLLAVAVVAALTGAAGTASADEPPYGPEWSADAPGTGPEWSADAPGTGPEWSADAPGTGPEWQPGANPGSADILDRLAGGLFRR